MIIDFQRIFHPTPEQEIADLRKSLEIRKRAIDEHHCSTCISWTPPRDNLPGFVEDHGDCDYGRTVDTVENCELYIQDVIGDDKYFMQIMDRIEELEKELNEHE